MFKKISIIVGLIVVIALICVILLIVRLTNMAHTIESELDRTGNIDLSRIADGSYHGSYGSFVVSASVEVVVRGHRIEKIIITGQNCGQGYEAKDTINRIIKAQSPRVEAVTGASTSSRSIMVAVSRALTHR